MLRTSICVIAFVSLACAACADVATAEDTSESTAAVRWSADRFTLSDGGSRNSPHFGDAYWMARFSELAYEEPARIEEELSKVGATGELAFFTNPATDTQAFFLGTSTHVVLVFRGTELGKADLMTDAKRSRRPTIFGKVHKGFHEAFESVWLDNRGLVVAGAAHPGEGLWSFLQRRKSQWPSGRRLFVAGHSLGGALATLASVYITFARCSELYAGDFAPQSYPALIECRRQPSLDGLASYLPVDAVHTFGSPRVGDEQFARLAGTLGTSGRRVFRFTHGTDAVPSLPYFGYWHPLRLGREDEGHLEVALPRRRSLANMNFAAWQAYHDHGSARYRSAVLQRVAPDLEILEPPPPDTSKAHRYARAYASELLPSDFRTIDPNDAPRLLKDFLDRIPSDPEQHVDIVELQIDDERARAIRVHRSQGTDRFELAFLFDAERLVVTMGVTTDAQGRRNAFVVDASQPLRR